jgi:hypothetical protein
VSPFRIILFLVVLVLFVSLIQALVAVYFKFLDQLYLIAYGQPFSFDLLPQPFGSVLKEIWNVIMPNLWLFALVFGLILEFVLAFRKTHEGYEQTVVWG